MYTTMVIMIRWIGHVLLIKVIYCWVSTDSFDRPSINPRLTFDQFSKIHHEVLIDIIIGVGRDLGKYWPTVHNRVPIECWSRHWSSIGLVSTEYRSSRSLSVMFILCSYLPSNIFWKILMDLLGSSWRSYSIPLVKLNLKDLTASGTYFLRSIECLKYDSQEPSSNS